MPGKRVQIDDGMWTALSLLASDRNVDFQALAEEAFRDLLRKHGRPTSLRAALRSSVGASADVHPFPKARTRSRPRRRK